MLLMVFHAIMRQISNHCFCAISLLELSVCAIFYAFSNYAKPLGTLEFECNISKPDLFSSAF